MRLTPTLFAAALAAVAVAHEFQGEWEHDGEVRKGHPVGFVGEPRFKEASWWERLQGKHHHARDADAEADVHIATHEPVPVTNPHHGHHGHGGKHHGHGGKHHGHGGKHHGHAGMHHGHEGKHHEGKHGKHGGHGKHHPGHKEHGEHHMHDKHGHGGPPSWLTPFEGEQGKHGHGLMAESSGHHDKPVWNVLPHAQRSVDTEEDEDDEEVDPNNEFFDSTDFDNDDSDDSDDFEDEDDEPDHLLPRAIENAEVEADPNESTPDVDYYNLGDDGDNDILDGQLGDAQDVPDDEDLTKAGLDEDGDDEDDEDETDDDADEDDDAEGGAPAKRWADVKRDANKKMPKPKPKPKGWGFFPW